VSCTSLSTGILTISGANTFTNLTLGSGTNTSSQFIFSANQTITGTLTGNGNSVVNRAYYRSSVRGTARTLTAATVTMTNIDLQDITGAGAGSWDLSAISGGSGDCGGNSSITFTTPANQYWVPTAGTSTGSESQPTRWATSSGGTAGTGRSPLPQDTAYFDANSIDAGSRTITQDKPRIGAHIWTGATNTPAWAKTTTCAVFGEITMINAMTQSGTAAYTFEGRSSNTLTAGSTTWTNPITIDCVNSVGTLVFGDNIVSSSTFTPTSGTASAASKTIEFTALGTLGDGQLNLVSSTMNFSAGGWSISGSGTGGGLAANPMKGFIV